MTLGRVAASSAPVRRGSGSGAAARSASPAASPASRKRRKPATPSRLRDRSGGGPASDIGGTIAAGPSGLARLGRWWDRRRPGLILQHGVDAPPALLTEWARARGIEHEVHRTWQEPLPADPAAYGWIATLGSEHTPGAEGAPDWVDAEIDFLRRALELDVPVLGLCFGGQALAVAAGGSVAPSDPPEIGWYEVATSDPALVPPGPWLHYHYDQLTPPPNADVIARAGSGPAAFALGRSLGLQFHPESTAEIGAGWARMDADQLERRGLRA